MLGLVGLLELGDEVGVRGQAHEVASGVEVGGVFDGHGGDAAGDAVVAGDEGHLGAEDLGLAGEEADAVGQEGDIGGGKLALLDLVDHEIEAAVLEGGIVAGVLDHDEGALGGLDPDEFAGGPADVGDDLAETPGVGAVDLADAGDLGGVERCLAGGFADELLIEITHGGQFGGDLFDAQAGDGRLITGHAAVVVGHPHHDLGTLGAVASAGLLGAGLGEGGRAGGAAAEEQERGGGDQCGCGVALRHGGTIENAAGVRHPFWAVGVGLRPRVRCIWKDRSAGIGSVARVRGHGGGVLGLHRIPQAAQADAGVTACGPSDGARGVLGSL